MALSKTPAGLAALKDRHGSLTPRQRTAFILFDGKRSTEEVLAATAAMGITQADVQTMLEQGLLCADEGFSGTAMAAAVPVSPDETLAAVPDEAATLGACRTLGVESENAPQRGQFLPDSPPHSGTMGQEAGKKWAAAAHSQPTIPKSDRLLARRLAPWPS